MATDVSSLLWNRLRSIRPLTAFPFVVFLGWILSIAIIIHQTPSAGESSPDAPRRSFGDRFVDLWATPIHR